MDVLVISFWKIRMFKFARIVDLKLRKLKVANDLVTAVGGYESRAADRLIFPANPGRRPITKPRSRWIRGTIRQRPRDKPAIPTSKQTSDPRFYETLSRVFRRILRILCPSCGYPSTIFHAESFRIQD